VGAAIGTWSDTSGKSNHASSSGSVSNSHASPVLVEHTDSQGSVHKVARFGCSDCASASPTWGTLTSLQTTSQVFSTQSDGLEAWAVLRNPDTGDASDDTAASRFVFDFGDTTNRGYGLKCSAGKVDGYTPIASGGKYDGGVTTVTRSLTIVRMRVVFGSGGVMRLEQNGQLVQSASINLAGLTASQIDTSQEFLIGSQSKSYNRNSRFFKGEMAELTLYDGLLSDDAAAQQLAQLAALYGISIPDSNRGASDYAYVLLGARYGYGNSGNFKVAAIGDYHSVFASTSSSSTAYLNRGTYWYHYPGTGSGGSMGFAPNAAVSLSPADTASPEDNTRMSWHLDQSSGGYRAGSTDVSALYKVVLYCNGE